MAAGDLEHLRTVLTVARAGSISEAARLLGIAQPTASGHVQQVEAAVGFAVFDRTTTGMRPTARGAELIRRIEAPIDALEDAVAPVRPDAPAPLRIGGPAELCSIALVPRITTLIAAAGSGVRVSFGLADDLLDELRRGGLDIVVSSVPVVGPGLTASPLVDEEFVLVAAPAVDPGGIDPAALAGIPIVAYAEHLPIIRRYWRSAFESRLDALDLAAVVPDLRGVRDAVIAGAGMSVLPRYIVADAVESGALVELHTPAFAPLNTVFLATRSGALERTPRLRAVAAAIRDAVADAGIS
jgi:DNA-binding transcriptional LysR family regulator